MAKTVVVITGSGIGIGNPTGPTGGIIGVASKSKDKSIRIYNGRNHYNEWAFVYQPPQQVPGAVPGSVVPGQGPPGQSVPGQIPGQTPFPGGQRNPRPGQGVVPSIERPSPFGPPRPPTQPGRPPGR